MPMLDLFIIILNFFKKKYKIELLTKENRTLLIEKKIYFISIEVIKLRVVINNTKV